MQSQNYYLAMTDDNIVCGEVLGCDKELTPLSLAKVEQRDTVVLSTCDRKFLWKRRSSIEVDYVEYVRTIYLSECERISLNTQY